MGSGVFGLSGGIEGSGNTAFLIGTLVISDVNQIDLLLLSFAIIFVFMASRFVMSDQITFLNQVKHNYHKLPF